MQRLGVGAGVARLSKDDYWTRGKFNRIRQVGIIYDDHTEHERPLTDCDQETRQLSRGKRARWA